MEEKITMGIVSPSNSLMSFYPNRVNNGIEFLNTQNIQVEFSPHSKKQEGYVSSTIENRVDDFNKMVEKDNIDLIMASIGGYNSNQILDQIHYQAFKESNKILCGYSDMTAVLLATYTKTGKIVFHGPTFLPEICEYPSPNQYTWKYFWKVIHKEKVEYEMPKKVVTQFIDWAVLEKGQVERTKETNFYPWRIIKKGKAIGKVIGGNMSTIMNLLGSEYLPYSILQDKILFLEECDTSIAKIDSLFYGLYLQGVFEKIKGLIIGKFNQQEINEKINVVEKIIKEVTKKQTYPIICNIDLGHTDPMITIPIGATAELEAKETIKFKIIEY